LQSCPNKVIISVLYYWLDNNPPFLYRESILNYIIQLKESIMAAKFEIYKDKKGEFRFRLKAANGEIIATGEGYKNKQGCENGIESVKKNAPEAEVVDLSDE
jgi:uncharacterized protein YegP (UPF0339 family)